MGVYQKIKRAFSFKNKDKKDKERRKSATGDLLAPNDTLAKGSSETHVSKNETPTLRKDTKKRSMSLRSIVRKASFGKKDNKDKKLKDTKNASNTYTPHDTTLAEPALLSDVIKPKVAELSEQKTEVAPVKQHTETVQPEVIVPEQTPASKAVEEPAVQTVIKTEAQVISENEPLTRQSECRSEDYEVVTPEVLKEIEEYEKQLQEEGVRVRVNEVEEPAPATKDVDNAAPASEVPQPKGKADHPEPHTITDVINLLSENSTGPNAATESREENDSARPADGATVDLKVTPESAAEAEVKVTTEIPAEKQNGTTNGHIVKPTNSVTKMANGKLHNGKLSSSVSTTYRSQSKDTQVKLWRGWIAAFVVVASVLAGMMFARNRSLL